MRRTLEETRQLLLDTGVTVLHERGVFVGVTHVRLAEVATTAGMTTGAAYRVWSCQEDFHRDLAVEAVRHRDQGPIDATVRLVLDLLVRDAPLEEVLRVGALANVRDARGDDPFVVALGLRALAGSVPELAAASQHRHETSMRSYEDLYRFMLARYGRRMRPPLTIAALSHALAALSEGFVVQSISGVPHPSYVLPNPGPGIGEEWSLLALATHGIVERLTERDPDAVAPSDTVGTPPSSSSHDVPPGSTA